MSLIVVMRNEDFGYDGVKTEAIGIAATEEAAYAVIGRYVHKNGGGYGGVTYSFVPMPVCGVKEVETED